MHWLDPSVLPIVNGTIACFTRNVRGDVDGVLLDDDRQIHLPPHMGASVEKLFSLGDKIEGRYVKPRDVNLYAAVSVTNAEGKTAIDPGPKPKHHKHDKPSDHPAKPKPATSPVEISGRVKITLYAPKGEVCGAVLESGEQLRVEPKANAELAPFFAKGAEIRVWGEALKRSLITVVDVSEIGFSKDFE